MKEFSPIEHEAIASHLGYNARIIDGFCMIETSLLRGFSEVFNPLANYHQMNVIISSIFEVHDCDLFYDDGYYFIYQFNKSYNTDKKTQLTHNASISVAYIEALLSIIKSKNNNE